MPRYLAAALSGAIFCSIVSFLPTAAHAEEAGNQSSSTLPPVIVKQAAPKPAKQKSSKKKKPAPEQPASPPATEGEASGQVAISPTLRPTPLSQTGSSVTVITGQDLEAKQSRTVPDALSDVPGLNVVQTGGPGGVTSIFIRGANANHTKVLVDGIGVSDPTSPDGSFDFAHLLTSGIDRIEVLRGPQSGLYGSDAIGGVIDIRTKPGSGPAQFTGSVEGGSFGTFNQTGGISGSSGPFSYSFNAAHFEAAGVPVTPLNLLPPGQARIDDSYGNQTYSARLGLAIDKDFDVGVTTRYVESTLRFTGSEFNLNTFAYQPEPTRSESDTQQWFTRALCPPGSVRRRLRPDLRSSLH